MAGNTLVPDTSTEEEENSSGSDLQSDNVKVKRRRRGYRLNTNRVPRKQTALTKQQRTPCFVCNLKVVNVNRHLKEVHGYSPSRIPERRKETKATRYPCPVCKKGYVRIDIHLVTKHKISKDSKRYHQLMTIYYEEKDKVRLQSKPVTSTAAKPDISSSSGTETYNAADITTPPKLATSKSPLPGTSIGPVPSDFSVSGPSPLKSPAASSTPVISKLPSTPDSSGHQDYSEDSESSDGSDYAEDNSLHWPNEHARELLLEFQRHLCSFAGGCLRDVNADSHVNQVKTAWHNISRQYNISSLLSNQKVETWIDVFRARKAPGTVLSYLGSIRKFMEFLVNKKGMEGAGRMKVKLQGWSSSIRRLGRTHRWSKIVQDQEQQLTQDDLDLLKASGPYTKAQAVLKNYEDYLPLEEEQYMDVLAFLFLRIMLNTGQRAGAIANMQINEVQFAKENINEGGELVINVKQHKTCYLGPASLRVGADLADQLFIYLEHLRPESTTGNVFVQFRTNRKFQKGSDISRVVSRKFEGVIKKKISATSIRKTIATNMWKKHPEHRGVLATAMSHSQRTASEHYVLPMREEAARQVGRLISETMGQDDVVGTTETPKGKKRKRTDGTVNVENKTHGRRAFSAEEASFVINAAKSFLDCLIVPMQTEMRLLLQNTEEGRGILNRFTIKQIVDRVKCERNRRRRNTKK